MFDSKLSNGVEMATSQATASRSQPVTTALRWLVGMYFVAVGILHLYVPEGLPAMMAWMYDLDDSIHVIAGTAEILGGLGLVLPRLLGVATQLTVAASSGLGVLMLSAAVWHGGRGEWPQIFGNLVMAGLLVYIAVQEWRRLGR